MGEWYRPNAGIVVFNVQKKVLLCQRIDMADSWQFPQGGIDEGETPAEAAVRELREETSITRVTRVKTLDFAARYRFPDDVLTSLNKRGFTNAGQDMYWSLFYFNGEDSEIDLQTKVPEFKKYQWHSLQEAYDLIVDFKKPAYAVMLKEFAPLIEAYPV